MRRGLAGGTGGGFYGGECEQAFRHGQVIFYERATYTWVGGPSPQFYEEAIFYVPTFFGASYLSRSRSCAPKADKRLFYGRFRNFIPVHRMWEMGCFS